MLEDKELRRFSQLLFWPISGLRHPLRHPTGIFWNTGIYIQCDRKVYTLAGNVRNVRSLRILDLGIRSRRLFHLDHNPRKGQVYQCSDHGLPGSLLDGLPVGSELRGILQGFRAQVFFPAGKALVVDDDVSFFSLDEQVDPPAHPLVVDPQVDRLLPVPRTELAITVTNEVLQAIVGEDKHLGTDASGPPVP